MFFYYRQSFICFTILILDNLFDIRKQDYENMQSFINKKYITNAEQKRLTIKYCR